MRVLRDFHCAKEHITERYIDSEITSITCPVCGNEATRMLSCPPVQLNGLDPGLPGAWNKWADIRMKRHIKMAEQKRKDGL
jgi:hypothetical protein